MALKTPQRNIVYRDYFNDLGLAGSPAHRWKDALAGNREEDLVNTRGVDSGGPDNLVAGEESAIKCVKNNVVTYILQSRSAGMWGSGNTLDITKASGTATISGNTNLNDNTASFDNSYLGKKIIFNTGSQSLFSIIGIVDSNNITLSADATALNGLGYWVLEPTHFEMWWYVHEYPDIDGPAGLSSEENQQRMRYMRPLISSHAVNPNFNRISPSIQDEPYNLNPPASHFNRKEPGWHQTIYPIDLTGGSGIDPSSINLMNVTIQSNNATGNAVSDARITLAEVSLLSFDDEPRIAFSTDDGVYEYGVGQNNGVPRWAELLNQYGVKGTFFVNPGFIRTDHSRTPFGSGGIYCNVYDLHEIQDAGHIIANHTWDHLRMYLFTQPTFPGQLLPGYELNGAILDTYLESVQKGYNFLKTYGFNGYDLLATPFGEMRRDVVDYLEANLPLRQIATVLSMNNVRPYIPFNANDIFNYDYWPWYVDPQKPMRIGDINVLGLTRVKQFQCTAAYFTHGFAASSIIESWCQAHVAGDIEMITHTQMIEDRPATTSFTNMTHPTGSRGTRLIVRDHNPLAVFTEWEFIDADGNHFVIRTDSNGAVNAENVLSASTDYIEMWFPPYHYYRVRTRQYFAGRWNAWTPYEYFQTRGPLNSFEKFYALNSESITQVDGVDITPEPPTGVDESLNYEDD